mmetsp:Transcript_50269/g.125340  ORF Transcript_50269/g.125340 Transcript_50269/m.125340 type:complete len:254 (-) Transcript_50269:197-958(-)
MARCCSSFCLLATFSFACCILNASASLRNLSASILSSLLRCSRDSSWSLICCCSTWCVSLSSFCFFSLLVRSLVSSSTRYFSCACFTLSSTCASSTAALFPRSPAIRSAALSFACLSASLSALILSCLSAISIWSLNSRSSSILSLSLSCLLRSRSFSFSTNTRWYAIAFLSIAFWFCSFSSLICLAKSCSSFCSSCRTLSACSFLRCCTWCITCASAFLSRIIFWMRSSSCRSLSRFHSSYFRCCSLAASFS